MFHGVYEGDHNDENDDDENEEVILIEEIVHRLAMFCDEIFNYRYILNIEVNNHRYVFKHQ